MYTDLAYICLLSWIDKLILKATEEPRIHPFAAAKQCLSLYKSLQKGFSLAFFCFIIFSQTDFIFAQSIFAADFLCVIMKWALAPSSWDPFKLLGAPGSNNNHVIGKTQ